MQQRNTKDDPRFAVANPMESGFFRTIPLAAVVLSFAMVSFYYADLPARIPVHFDLGGVADNNGPKELLWLLPLLNLGLFSLLGYTPEMDFRFFNYPVTLTEENAIRQHRLALSLVASIRLVGCLLMAYLVYGITRSAIAGTGVIDARVVGVFLLALFVPIIYYTRQAYKAK